MNKKDLLNHLQNDIYCRLKISNIHGVGVFAIKDIKKGTSIFKNCNKVNFLPIKSDDITDLDPEVKTMILDFFAKENDTYYIPDSGLNSMDISFFLNHTNNPNVEFNPDTYEFIAIKNIAKGEEVTTDYSTFSE